MCLEKNVLDKKKIFINGLNMGLLLWAWVENIVHKVKHTDSSVKEKLQVQWSVKKVMLTMFWDKKGPIIIANFFAKILLVYWITLVCMCVYISFFCMHIEFYLYLF